MLKKLRSALVAGANGFIGSALVDRLAQEQVRVACLVRKGSPRLRTWDSQNITVVEVTEYAPQILHTALSRFELDAAFNLASAGVNPAQREPWALLGGNVNAIAGLLMGLHGKKPVRFIHIGSCAEYAPVEPGHKITERDPVRPTSLYGAAKICAFTYGAALAARLGMAFVTLRIFGVFGMGEAPYRLVPYVMERLGADKPVDLTLGEQVRDFLYVDDVVEGLILAATSEGLDHSGVYNLCSGDGVTVRQIAETVARVMKKPADLLHFGKRDYRSDEGMWIVGDPQRFKAATGWFPKVSMQEGMQRMVAQFK